MTVFETIDVRQETKNVDAFIIVGCCPLLDACYDRGSSFRLKINMNDGASLA